MSGRVIAIKEIKDELARREYGLLRLLNRLDQPAVEPLAVVGGRTGRDGQPLESALVTQHLQFSLPYRALFSQTLRPDTAQRLIDALAALLVRLHLAGFFWGDVSLSNTLFRRDAGAFAAYLVDAETGDLHDTLTVGQREYDLDLARTNIAGELMDLEAGGLLEDGSDPIETADQIVDRYHSLWAELTGAESFDRGERWRVDARIRKLNELGFDVDELAITTDIDGTSVRIQPKVVDAGHHSRRLLRLTGLDVEENQARRLLNDLDSYRAATDRQGEDEEIVAHDWLARVFQPVVRAVPRDLGGKLDPAEIFHEVLEHRWYLAEQAGRGRRADRRPARLPGERPAAQAGRGRDPRRRHRGAPRRRRLTPLTSAGAAAGDLVERDAGGDPGVQRLGGRGHRDAHDQVAGLPDQPGQALALGADHQHERLVDHLQQRQVEVAAGVQADHEAALPPGTPRAPG